jgi:hypothetical protein
MGITCEAERISLLIRSDAPVDDVPPPGLDDSLSWRLLRTVADRATFRSSGVGPSIELEFSVSALGA